MNNTIALNIKSLWLKLSPRRRTQFYGLIFLMVMSAVAEILSLGSVIPFLSILADSDQFLQTEYGMLIFSKLGNPEPQKLIFIFTLLFICFAILSGVIRLVLLWISTKVSYGAASDIAVKIYENTLYQPYSFHLKMNSSQIISAISEKVNEIAFGVLQSIPTITSSILIFFAIIGTLLCVDPSSTVFIVILFAIIYILINFSFKKRLIIHSEKISIERSTIIRKLQEGLASIRDVILDGSQPIYCENYLKSEIPLRRAQGENLFISMCPRYIVEGIAIVIIAISSYLLSSRNGGLTSSLPLIGVLVLGIQRMLPVFQQIYSSWVSIQSCQASLKVILNLLEEPSKSNFDLIDWQPLKFESYVELRKVDFSYSASKPFLLNQLNFRINKGEHIAIVGPSGSGKSTFIDILIGLLKPVNGSIFVDGKKIEASTLRLWQKKISHVPQALFITDDTIAANIAFGIPPESIDMNRVAQVASLAKIDDFINSTNLGYATILGERGVSISGGQRQRIGIARALYKHAEILIFDEATSALDQSTEEDIMASLRNLDKELTIIIVTHRLSALKYCDRAIKISNGKIEKYSLE